MADRANAGARVRPEGARRGKTDACHRQRGAADCVRVERHRHADLPGLGPRSAGGMLRPGRRHLAARVLRQHACPDRQQHRALSGDESRHGPPDSRDRGRVRLRPGHAPIEQAALAVLRRVECVVPRAFRSGHRRPPRRRAETARGGLQPRGRATRRRVRQHAAPERRARPRRLPRAARQRHRAARHERCRRAPAEHLLPVRVGLAVRARPGARPAGGIADVSDRRRGAAGRLRPRRTGAVSWTWSRRTIRSTARRVC